jgi:predicted nucleic acid-binding Zn ribbon protein
MKEEHIVCIRAATMRVVCGVWCVVCCSAEIVPERLCSVWCSVALRKSRQRSILGSQACWSEWVIVASFLTNAVCVQPQYDTLGWVGGVMDTAIEFSDSKDFNELIKDTGKVAKYRSSNSSLSDLHIVLQVNSGESANDRGKLADEFRYLTRHTALLKHRNVTQKVSDMR